MGFLDNCSTRCGCDSTDEHLHTPVFQCVVCVDCLLRIRLIILELILDLITVDAAVRIDLVNRKLHTVFHGVSVDRVVACRRSDAPDHKYISA